MKEDAMVSNKMPKINAKVEEILEKINSDGGKLVVRDMVRKNIKEDSLYGIDNVSDLLIEVEDAITSLVVSLCKKLDKDYAEAASSIIIESFIPAIASSMGNFFGELKFDIEHFRQKIDELEKDIDDLNEKVFELESEIEEKENTIEELLKEESYMNERILDLESELADTQAELKEEIERRNEIEDEKDELEYEYETWKQELSDCLGGV